MVSSRPLLATAIMMPRPMAITMPMMVQTGPILSRNPIFQSAARTPPRKTMNPIRYAPVHFMVTSSEGVSPLCRCCNGSARPRLMIGMLSPLVPRFRGRGAPASSRPVRRLPGGTAESRSNIEQRTLADYPVRAMFQLETDRLLLRPWLPADRPAFTALTYDPEVMRYVHGGLPYREDEVDEWVSRQGRQLAEHDVCMGAMIEE